MELPDTSKPGAQSQAYSRWIMRRYLIAVTAGAMFLTGCNRASATLPQPAGNFMPNQTLAHASADNPPMHYHVLHRFLGGADGDDPRGTLVRDSAGNVYGTTRDGGPLGKGTVFKIDAGGTLTRLAYFKEIGDGAYPNGGLLLDAAGNLYGTAARGGSSDDGVVFRLDPSGNETVIHTFDCSDGDTPLAGLTQDASGNFYGTTQHGGAHGSGVVYKLDASGNETLLHSFSDDEFPNQRVVTDRAGDVFGATPDGDFGYTGLAFKIGTRGKYAVLHSFRGYGDGFEPGSGLIRDRAGNLYGSTRTGGSVGGGIVYKIDRNGGETLLHDFESPDGVAPQGDLVRDSAGNLYGTTRDGGTNFLGVIFRLDPNGNETVLYNFNRRDGDHPTAGLIRDSAGNLYGTTHSGGSSNCAPTGCGVVFELSH
jgi:uncharacterized repeat protein (TIGR03803 family)